MTLRIATILSILSVLLVAVVLAVERPSSTEAGTAAGLAAGGDHTCALTASGAVKCFGYNGYGQLGTGDPNGPEICGGGFSDEYPCSRTPVDVVGLSSGVEAISAGNTHTCALMQDAGVKCWGENDAGQLGSGMTGPDSCPAGFGPTPCSPVPVDVMGFGTLSVTGAGASVLEVSVGDGHTCALLSDHTVRCWGANNLGQLGIASGPEDCGGFDCSTTPVPVPGIDDAIDINAGSGHTCVVTEGQQVKCWGINITGQVGNGTTGQEAPVSTVGGLSGVTQVEAYASHTCALASGAVKCWGSDLNDQLGQGTGQADCPSTPGFLCGSATPVDVPGIAGAQQLSSGNGQHMCVLGSVICWGNNAFGEVGNGMTGPDTCPSGFKCQSTPFEVQGLPGGIIDIVTGDDHTCILTDVGGILCWGFPFYGQTGDGDPSTQNRLNPVEVLEFENGTPTPTPSPTPGPGTERIWGDTDCGGAFNIGDAINVARKLINLAVNVQDGCPELGAEVTVDGIARLWGDTECGGAFNIGDAINIARKLINLAVNKQPGCPDLGTTVTVSDGG